MEVFKMQIKFSNEAISDDEFREMPSIFLAGPTSRTKPYEDSWRKKAIEYLDRVGFKGRVYVPEYKDKLFDKNRNFTLQCLWEKKALRNVDCILFWIPRDLTELPAFTTNVEFGTYVQARPKQVVYGRPDNAPKTAYLDWLYKDTCGEQSEVFNDMEKTLDKAKEIAEWEYSKHKYNVNETFQIIESLDQDKINDFFDKFKKGETIPINDFLKEFNVSKEVFYTICYARKDLKLFMNIICPSCKQVVDGKKYYSVAELPNEKIICDTCANVIDNVFEDAYVFFEKA
jgi:hypothetical protein